MPDVVGLTQGAAEADILAANLVVGDVTHEYNATIPAGSVISQDPAPPAELPSDSEVDIVVSLGPNPVYSGVGEDFESGFTLGQKIGTHADWYDGGDGPVVTDGNGIAGSTGLAPDTNIFTWTAQPFDWNDPQFWKLILQMDFETSSDIDGGEFDDDRMGWMISNNSTSSSDIFGVQLDHADGGIVTYWRNGSTRIQDVIVPLTAGTGIDDTNPNTWYRFRAEITKLTDTSARVDVSLEELDAGGNPTAKGWTGSVTDTSTWLRRRTDGSPNITYFTAATMWPAFKNFDGNDVDGAADNAYVEVILKSVVIPLTSTMTAMWMPWISGRSSAALRASNGWTSWPWILGV